MIDRIRLKSMAKEQIKWNIPVLFLCMLAMGAVSAVVSLVPVLGAIAVAVVMPAVSVGFIKIFLNMTNGEKPQFETLFSAMPVFLKAFAIEFLVGLFTMLWSLLLIVPGIIKGISYGFAPYILAENHNVGIMEAIEISKKITKGHKMELFVLGLSFILWGLLTAVTFGIAAVYVGPYVSATMANAYNELKGDAGINEVIVEDKGNQN